MALAGVGAMVRHVVLVSAAVTLLVLAVESAATPRQSVPDQYEQQPSAPPRSLHPKLNRVHLAHTGYHRFSLLPTNNQKEVRVPELQVGCAEGSLHVHHAEPHRHAVVRNKRQVGSRVVWFNVDSQQTNTPTVQSYQLRSTVPFYLPVWGNPGRIPVFFPAKPILFNPGYPIRNRPVADTTPNVTIGTRIRDDKPSWGVVEPATSTVRPLSTGDRPTKPPTPPLFHRPSHSEDQVAEDDRTVIAENIDMVFSTSTPPPPPPMTSAPTNGDERVLNRCVWAIISCCNPTSPQVKASCFEQLGCPGAFWDRSPCSREVTVAALNAAQKFYDQS